MTADPILRRLPHEGPMLFLDEVLSVSDTKVETRVTLGEDFLMCGPSGAISPLVALELFAQSAAALMAHRAGGPDAPPVSGALLGTRKLDCHVDALLVGDVLRIEAEERWGAEQLAQFQCTLYRETPDGEEKVAEGAINVVAGPVDASGPRLR